jgi:hypothetical protein
MVQLVYNGIGLAWDDWHWHGIGLGWVQMSHGSRLDGSVGLLFAMGLVCNGFGLDG